MLSVLATRPPPTLTLAPGANRMPFVLTRNTWPLAVSDPKISEAWLPTTRLSATEETFGCTKLTASEGAMEKPSQLRIAFGELWLIRIVCAFGCEMLAEPA